MAERIGCHQRVLGPDWLEGKATQDDYWSLLRREFDRYVRVGGWQLESEPVERTEYDEQLGDVIISIRARATRERDPAPA